MKYDFARFRADQRVAADRRDALRAFDKAVPLFGAASPAVIRYRLPVDAPREAWAAYYAAKDHLRAEHRRRTGIFGPNEEDLADEAFHLARRYLRDAR